MDLIKTHPYFFANLPVLFLVLVASALARPGEYRRMAWLGGLSCVPGSMAALLHNGRYWNPVRLGGGPLGIEDVSFTFTVGAMAWLLAAFPFRRRLAVDGGPSSWAIRTAVGCIAFAGLSFCLWIAGLKGLANTLEAGSAALVVVLLLRRNLWPLAASGILLFAPTYCSIVKIQFAFWPDFIMQWNLDGPLGVTFLGLPIGEQLYAMLFGAGWPVYIAWIFGVTFRSKSVPSQ